MSMDEDDTALIADAWYCSGTQRRYKRMLVSAGLWREPGSKEECLLFEILELLDRMRKDVVYPASSSGSSIKDLEQSLRMLNEWSDESKRDQSAKQILGEALLACVKHAFLDPVSTLIKYGANIHGQVSKRDSQEGCMMEPLVYAQQPQRADVL